MKKKINESILTTIAFNRNACHDYFIEKEIEAGLILQGWEVKSLRAGSVNIRNSYVLLKKEEAFLFGANFMPPVAVSSHQIYEQTRIRKLLLNQRELNYLYNFVNRDGYTVVTLSLYWKNAWCKIKIGIAKGKKQYDKRINLKERKWQLDKARIMKNKRY